MSTRDSSPLLAADAATRCFGDLVAVDEVTLEVHPGEIIGLLGANGAGKTTLIKMMLGLLPASSGSVRMFDGAPSRTGRQRLGYVSQGLGLYRDLTVDENVRFQASAFGIPPDAVVLPPELEGSRNRLVASIGLGRQRQLAFACALAHQPDVLVLDEPTSGVDPLARARLWDAIRGEAARRAGVLVTTHYMDEAVQCDRLVLMADGKVAASGRIDDILADRFVIEVDADSWASAFDVLGHVGFDLMLAGTRIRVASTDLDAVAEALADTTPGAELRLVPATLDEAMVAIASSQR